MRVKEIPEINSNTSAVVIGEADQRMLQSAFYAERDSFQESVEREAKAQKKDKFELYAQILFSQRLSERFDYAKSKQTKVLKGALAVLIATGKSEVEARKMLGLGD